MKLGFKNAFTVAAAGTARGISLLWNDEVNLRWVWNTDHIICRDVVNAAGKPIWNLFAWYGLPYNDPWIISLPDASPIRKEGTGGRLFNRVGELKDLESK